MKFSMQLSLMLLLLGSPATGQSVSQPGDSSTTQQAAALDRQRAMAALAARLDAQPNSQASSRKQADWLVVEREWTASAATRPQLTAAAGGTTSQTGSSEPSTKGQSADRSLSNRNAAKQRATATTSIGSQNPNRVRVGSTIINVKTGDVSTTARYGDAETNIGTRNGGSGTAKINVRAGNVVTDATGGNATTNIGARSGSGTSQVVTGTTVTRSRGGSATTNIGNGDGVVSTNFTYNEGGTLTIGASGISRNGLKCIEIFRQTCIVHIYIRRKSDPCAPGYWISFRRCLLPSDLSHKIRE